MSAIPRLPDCLASRYTAREVLVASHHADVLRVTDLAETRDVAVTHTHSDSPVARDRIAHGIEHCSALHHSTVPEIIEVGVGAKVPYLVSSLLPGARRVSGPLAGRTVRAMAIDLLSLVHLLEHERLEHPRLDADHVLVTPDGAVQVRGWGGVTEALPGAAARMRFDVGRLLHGALTGCELPTETLADPHASVAQAIERHAPAAFALDPILVGVIDALAQADPDRRPEPVVLLELLGLSASSLGGIGDDPDRSFRRMRHLFGLGIM